MAQEQPQGPSIQVSNATFKTTPTVLVSPAISGKMAGSIDVIRRNRAQNNTNDSGYVKERYIRFAIAYKEFVEKTRPIEGRSPILSELALFNISVFTMP